MYSAVNNFVSRLSLVFPLFVTVCLARIRGEDCGPEELAQCARPLQVLTATSELSFVTKKEELDKLCPDLFTGLRCIHSYTRRCMSAAQRSHFGRLYRGTETVIRELCAEGEYQDEFLRHAPCMREVKAQYEVCSNRYTSKMAELNKPTTTTEAPLHHHRYRQILQRGRPTPKPQPQEETIAEAEARVQTVCCSFQEYMQCSQHTVRRKCGEETALFTRKFLDKMSNSLIQLHCSEYGPESGKCELYSSASWRSPSLWTYILAALVPMFLIR